MHADLYWVVGRGQSMHQQRGNFGQTVCQSRELYPQGRQSVQPCRGRDHTRKHVEVCISSRSHLKWIQTWPPQNESLYCHCTLWQSDRQQILFSKLQSFRRKLNEATADGSQHKIVQKVSFCHRRRKQLGRRKIVQCVPQYILGDEEFEDGPVFCECIQLGLGIAGDQRLLRVTQWQRKVASHLPGVGCLDRDLPEQSRQDVHFWQIQHWPASQEKCWMAQG